MNTCELEEGLMAAVAEHGEVVKKPDDHEARAKVLGVCLERPDVADSVMALQRAVNNNESLPSDKLKAVGKAFEVSVSLPRRKKRDHEKASACTTPDLTLNGAVECGLLSDKFASMVSGCADGLLGAIELVKDQSFVAGLLSVDDATLSDLKPYLDNDVYATMAEILPWGIKVQDLVDAGAEMHGNDAISKQFQSFAGESLSGVCDELDGALLGLAERRAGLPQELSDALCKARGMFLADCASGSASKYDAHRTDRVLRLVK